MQKNDKKNLKYYDISMACSINLVTLFLFGKFSYNLAQRNHSNVIYFTTLFPFPFCKRMFGTVWVQSDGNNMIFG